MPPSDSTVASEYGAESVKSKKILCPKHTFLLLVVKGRFVSTKSFGWNSGRNLNHQLWNFAAGNRASLKIFCLRYRLAVCQQHGQEHSTERRTKHPAAPPAPLCVVVLSFLCYLPTAPLALAKSNDHRIQCMCHENASGAPLGQGVPCFCVVVRAGKR